MAKILYSTPGTLTLAIAGDASSPSLKNLANNTAVLSNAIATNRDQYSDWRLRYRGASMPTAGRQVRGWFIIDPGDMGTYEDGAAGVFPVRQPDLVFAVRAVATQQIIAVRNVLKPNGAFKILLLNDTGFAMTNTDDENQLHYSLYSDEV